MSLSFLADLSDGVAGLLAIGTADKLAAFDAGARFLSDERGVLSERGLLSDERGLLSAERGRGARERLVDELILAGYPEISAHLEVALLPTLLARDRLAAMIGNPTVLPGGADLLDGECVPLADGMTVAGFPIGPVLVIGSGNAFLPAVSACVQALLANCPVALRGSRLNQRVLEHLVDALRAAGDPVLGALLEHLHLFFVDHRDPEDNRRLQTLLRSGPFDAGVFWGGREMLDAVLPHFAANPRHPLAVPMEPLTGVAFVTQRWVERSEAAPAESALQLSRAMVVFGQQLCSSPTEAYFVGDPEKSRQFAAELARELGRSAEAGARTVADREAVLLDRVRDRGEELGAVVHTPPRGSAAWTVVASENRSVFERFPVDLRLPIHDRHGFLEVISVPDVETVADRIAALPSAPGHDAIKQVQTVLRLAHMPDAQRLAGLLRARRGVYRVVPPDYVAARHPLEPSDGQHLLSLLTRRTIIF